MHVLHRPVELTAHFGRLAIANIGAAAKSKGMFPQFCVHRLLRPFNSSYLHFI
jgi:hypothetical protein